MFNYIIFIVYKYDMYLTYPFTYRIYCFINYTHKSLKELLTYEHEFLGI